MLHPNSAEDQLQQSYRRQSNGTRPDRVNQTQSPTDDSIGQDWNFQRPGHNSLRDLSNAIEINTKEIIYKQY